MGFQSRLAWLPAWRTVYADLSYVPSARDDALFASVEVWRGMPLRWRSMGREEGGEHFYSSTYWSRQSAEHWEIPLLAVAAYVVMIPVLKRVVARRGPFDVKGFAFYWNAFLSLFSGCGVAACMPVLLSSLLEHGLYFTTCAPAAWYGSGTCGFFMALFVYSKVAELVDTALLLLAGKPVIALQWWHHSTVLLYTWHCFAVRIATGTWFAAMNYSVHSLMYGYFAATATQYRKLVVPYAMHITLLQLLQMLVGIFVTLKAVLYQAAGEECHVNKTNSILGLAMYVSYFLLFFKLFVDNYYLKPRSGKKKATLREVVREVSRSVSAGVFDEDPAKLN